MPFVASRAGGQIWYEQCGNGPALLFVHGWCLSSAIWQLQQELAERFRLVVYDLRGHGRSSVPPRGMGGFAGHVDDLADLMGALDLQDTVAVGWSLGAQVLLRGYASLGDRLSGLVLVGATPRFTAAPHFPYGLPAREAAGMMLKVRRNLERALNGFHRQLFAEGEVTDPLMAEQIRSLLATVPIPASEAALDGLEALMNADMLLDAPRIDCPVLLVHGDQDHVCLPQASAWLAQAIGGSRRVIYPGCGHAPFLSRAAQFNRDLALFAGTNHAGH